MRKTSTLEREETTLQFPRPLVTKTLAYTLNLPLWSSITSRVFVRRTNEMTKANTVWTLRVGRERKFSEQLASASSATPLSLFLIHTSSASLSFSGEYSHGAAYCASRFSSSTSLGCVSFSSTICQSSLLDCFLKHLFLMLSFLNKPLEGGNHDILLIVNFPQEKSLLWWRGERKLGTDSLD